MSAYSITVVLSAYEATPGNPVQIMSGATTSLEEAFKYILRTLEPEAIPSTYMLKAAAAAYPNGQGVFYYPERDLLFILNTGLDIEFRPLVWSSSLCNEEEKERTIVNGTLLWNAHCDFQDENSFKQNATEEWKMSYVNTWTKVLTRQMDLFSVKVVTRK